MDVLDEKPILNVHQIKFILWISEYYMCSVGEVYNAALPTNLKLSSDSYVHLVPDVEIDSQSLNDHEFNVIQALKHNELSTEEIRQVTGLKSPYRIIKSLQELGYIHLYEKLKDKYSPKTETRVRLSNEYMEASKIEAITNSLEKHPKQMDVILSYLQSVNVLEFPTENESGLTKKSLISEGISPSSLGTLVKKGVFELWEEKVDRFGEITKASYKIPSLSPLQELTFGEINEHFEHNLPVLLKGVTGSGKTEIYVKLIDEQISLGKQSLYLLPEIALTTQIISRFRRIFGNRFGIYHSRVSDNERAETFKNCLEGKFDFVIGVRSSTFLPFQDLGLIIVDEEHESSYKQYDPAPRYNARDCAIYLAKIHKANILLGTATPSMESHFNGLNGKYGYVHLNERYGEQPLPEISYIDLKKSRKQKTLKGFTSQELLSEIEASIENEKQVILFQSRRGYAPFLQCDSCQSVPKCMNCSVSLTYHIYQNQLVCHYCGFKQFFDPNCGTCGSDRLRTVGAGTEKIEEELSLLLPDVKIKRMDLDTTRNKNSYQKIIDDFEKGDIQILIGTQMVTKGLDFDHVNLVGVYDIDRLIHYPDFRSHEKSFQMITQVSGRSGRKHEKGKVLIQTSDPEHPVLKEVLKDDPFPFYQNELDEREAMKYPPYFRLIKIVLRDRDKKLVSDAVNRLHLMLQKDLGNRVLNPVEPLIGKIRNYYLQELFIRVERENRNLKAIKEYAKACRDTLLALPAFKSLVIHFDVDPL